MASIDHMRAKRYMQDEDDLCKSANFNQIKPFFNGDSLSKRMDKIREGILYIRENWHRYDDFVKLVQNYVDESVEDEEAKQLMEKVLDTRRDWATCGDTVDEGFGAIRLYTSEKGYDEIFALINRVFRDDGSTAHQDLILAAVFVIEMINIDLFNLCVFDNQLSNFTGIVYRGMAIKDSDIAAFESLRSENLSGRYFAIPLCLISASTSLHVANAFIARELHGRVDRKPILMKIHVIELEKHYLDYYKKRFPSSVVSTICAVDIHNLSHLPNEKEVLLRGPFFQVLDLYDGHSIQNQTCKILEMVMLNTNRDHISIVQLGSSIPQSRQLFGNMVAATRCKFAIRYCEEKGLQKDSEAYRKLLQEKLNKLDELITE